MAGSVNTVLLVGYVGSDPAESRAQTDSVSFSLATTDRWCDDAGRPWEHTDWHRVRCYGRVADVARSWVVKGGLLSVDGRLRVYDVASESGPKRRVVEVIASRLLLLSPPVRRNAGGLT